MIDRYTTEIVANEIEIMKFTDEQIEDFRRDLGLTGTGAKQAMGEVAAMLANHLATLIDDEDLRDCDSYAQGMWHAVEVLREFSGGENVDAVSKQTPNA